MDDGGEKGKDEESGTEDMRGDGDNEEAGEKGFGGGREGLVGWGKVENFGEKGKVEALRGRVSDF